MESILRKALTLSSFHDVEIVTIYAADKQKAGLSSDSGSAEKRSGMWIFLEQFNKGRVSYMQGSHAVSLKI